MDTKKITRVVKKPAVRRKEIVDTATQLFLEHGYEHTSTNDVMKTLGIAKGTIYHYFPSKEALMEAVVDQLAENFVQRRVQALEEVDGDAIMKIQAYFGPEQRTEEEAETTEKLHDIDNVKLHTRLLAVLVEKMSPPFGALIQLGCDEGHFQAEHPNETAEFLLAGIQFLTDDGVYPWSRSAMNRRSLAFPSIVESVLNAPEGSFNWLSRTAEPHPPDEELRD